MKVENSATKAYVYDQEQMLEMIDTGNNNSLLDDNNNNNTSRNNNAKIEDDEKKRKYLIKTKKFIKKVNVFGQLSTLCFTSMLFFGFLFENAYVGVTFGVYGFIHALVEHFVKKKDLKKTSILYKLVANDSVTFYKMGKKNFPLYFSVYVITAIMFLSPGISALSDPTSKNYTLFGKHTYLMIYIQIVTLPFLHFCYVVGVRFNRVVIKYISLTCKRKIEEYIKRIRDTLLSFDVETGDKEKCWQDIYEVQKDVEQWAHDINKSMSTSNGVQLFLNLVITTIMLLMTGKFLFLYIPHVSSICLYIIIYFI